MDLAWKRKKSGWALHGELSKKARRVPTMQSNKLSSSGEIWVELCWSILARRSRQAQKFTRHLN